MQNNVCDLAQKYMRKTKKVDDAYQKATKTALSPAKNKLLENAVKLYAEKRNERFKTATEDCPGFYFSHIMYNLRMAKRFFVKAEKFKSEKLLLDGTYFWDLANDAIKNKYSGNITNCDIAETDHFRSIVDLISELLFLFGTGKHKDKNKVATISFLLDRTIMYCDSDFSTSQQQLFSMSEM